MYALVVTALLFLAVSFFYSMFGKGGGELFMVILVALEGLPYYKAAGITLFVLMLQGLSMLLVYHRRLKLVDWLLAAMTGTVVAAAAFAGGYLAGELPARILKLIFSSMLVISAYLIVRGFSLKSARVPGPRIRRQTGGYVYEFNPLAVAAPVSLIAFLAAMAGISGGSLIVPVLVLLGGVPLRVAIGTNPFLVLVSSTFGFIAHSLRGGFDPRLALALGASAVAGSQLGSRMHARLSDRALRLLFAATMLFAAAIMAARAL